MVHSDADLWDNPIRRLGYAESKGKSGADGTVSLKAIPLDSAVAYGVCADYDNRSEGKQHVRENRHNCGEK